MKFPKISWRIWLLLVVLLASALIISPTFETGVVVKTVGKNSTAFDQGIKPNQIIQSINDNPIKNSEDYSRIINSIFPSKNKTSVKIITKEGEFILFDKEAPNIAIADIPRSKIKTGLDLSGGARALVKAENKSLNTDELNDLISVTSNRLNEFGIADVTVKQVSDLSGNNFMLIEIAGATPTDLEDLVSKQGKFEAKIGNDTVFIGGQEDITYVARTGDQSGIYSCDVYNGEQACSFRFAITLSEKAAKRQASITNNLSTDPSNPEYLNKKLDLYLDNSLVDSLSISRDLKGRETTQISIQGSGKGATQKEAYEDALNNMKKLQTILITGSLPFKLEIVKIDTISPVLGKEFTKNLIILGLIVFILVSGMLFLKFKRIKVTAAVILTLFSEAFITLAIAALIKWNLDAASIAGIIAGMGTGIDDQIVILDEAEFDKQHASLKERVKNAFFIILSAFALTIVAMLPLFWAGAGMLKGFALTTIIGVSAGILITRPAFSEIIKLIIKE